MIRLHRQQLSSEHASRHSTTTHWKTFCFQNRLLTSLPLRSTLSTVRSPTIKCARGMWIIVTTANFHERWPTRTVESQGLLTVCQRVTTFSNYANRTIQKRKNSFRMYTKNLTHIMTREKRIFQGNDHTRRHRSADAENSKTLSEKSPEIQESSATAQVFRQAESNRAAEVQKRSKSNLRAIWRLGTNNRIIDTSCGLVLKKPIPTKRLLVLTDNSLWSSGHGLMTKYNVEQKLNSMKRTLHHITFGLQVLNPSRMWMSFYSSNFSAKTSRSFGKEPHLLGQESQQQCVPVASHYHDIRS